MHVGTVASFQSPADREPQITNRIPFVGLNADSSSLMEGTVKLKPYFASQPKWLLLGECIGAAMLIGIMDFNTSWEVSLFAFYGIPVFIASWYLGKLQGLLLGLVAGVV